MTTSTPLRVVSYVRVSTSEQARSGAGLQAQRDQVAAACRERGWTHVAEHADEGVSAKAVRNRHGLAAALAAVEAGEADALIVAKLDRLSRSVADFCSVLDQSRRQGWALVCLDLGLDTSTPTGKFTAQIIAAVAELERELIGQRTRDGLAVKRSEGVVLGRPRTITPELADRIRGMRETMTLHAICDTLNAEGVPTPRGGSVWRPSSLRAVLPPTNPRGERRRVA